LPQNQQRDQQQLQQGRNRHCRKQQQADRLMEPTGRLIRQKLQQQGQVQQQQ
jgi:hypothetical protein